MLHTKAYLGDELFEVLMRYARLRNLNEYEYYLFCAGEIEKLESSDWLPGEVVSMSPIFAKWFGLEI